MFDGISVVDTAGRQLYVNDALCSMLGFSHQELIGARPPFAYWPADQLAVIEGAFRRTLQGDSKNLQLVFQRKDGTRLDVMVAPAALRDPTGATIAFAATVKDVTEYKRMERALMESERRWRSIAENPFDFVVLIDRQYRYTWINHAAPGLRAEDMIGKATPFDFVDTRHHDEMRAAFDTAFETGRATSYEVHVPQLDAWYSSVVGPLFEQGRVTGLSILTRDITEQRRAQQALERTEQRLRDAHRLETIGTLTGGVAHDINNLLTPILAHAELAQGALAPAHEARRHLEAIALAGERARELVQRLLLFSRHREPHKSRFDLRECVREHLALLETSRAANVQVLTELPSEAVPVFADRAQIGQAVANLVSNAIQAMQAAGGTLRVVVEQEPRAGVARLQVIDTGPGMDEETKRRAFDPFFTTKPFGEGTGLGLSIVHGVVREHGGEILVESAPGRGSVFTLSLPSADPALPEPAAAALGPAAQARTARVLVVDDEPAIRAVASEALGRAGHRVVAAPTAAKGLECFAAEPDGFDVVLTDLTMPGQTGLELIRHVHELRPEARCLLMTGGGGDFDDPERRRALGVTEVLEKPFSIASLLAAVERAAGARRG